MSTSTQGERFEQIFAVLGLISFLDPFANSVPILPWRLGQLLLYGVWGLSTLFVLIRLSRSLYVVSRAWLVWVLLVMQALSFVWSVNPDYSFEKAADILRIGSFALYLAGRFSLRDQVRFVAIATSITGVLSIISVALFPSVSLHFFDFPGAWKGVFTHKNGLGSYMATAAISCFLVATDRHYKSSRLAWWGVVLGAFLMLRSTSKTALVITVIVLAGIYCCRNFRWRGKLAIIILDFALLFLCTAVFFVLNFWVNLLTGLGKDPTLTGRTPMWEYLIIQMEDRPLLGFGRSGFFYPGSPHAQKLYQVIGFGPPHAHNGYLELALDIGLIGLGIFLVVLILAYSRAVYRVFTPQDSGDLWPLALLMITTINNVTESFLFHGVSIYLTLLLATIQSLPLARRSIAPTASTTAIVKLDLPALTES